MPSDLPKWIKCLSGKNRAERAKELQEPIDRLIRECIWLFATYEHVVISDKLAKQIPTSTAANAFNFFRDSQSYLVTIRLCALWDSANRKDRQSIPVVCGLIDHPDVMQALATEYGEWWYQQSLSTTRPYPKNASANLKRNIDRLQEAAAARTRNSETTKAKRWLRAFVYSCKCTLQHPRFKAVMQTRNTMMAHWLSDNEPNDSKPSQMKHNDIEWLLKRSMKIAFWMRLGVQGHHVNWTKSLSQLQEITGYFWNGVTIKVLR